MKKLILLLLAALLLAGCATSPAAPETTVPEAVPAIAALPETTAAPDPMDLLLESMTFEQKVGQLFIAYPEQLWADVGPVTAMSDGLAQALEQYPVGGIILFADNIVTPDQLSALTGALAEAPGIPLFIAVDEEGGTVTRLARNKAFGLPRYGSAKLVGYSKDSADALEMGQTIGAYLNEYGFNLNFAPVADVNTNPNNPVIGSRAFSDHPEIAAQMVSAFRNGLRENGIIATFKHFPGHGDTAQDSHTGLAVSYRTREEQESCEWLPFREATALDMVMTAHVALPNVTGDMAPATLSREIVTGILKEHLGFEGLVVTDAMNMGAIVEGYGCAEATVSALLAGCDIILMPESLPEAFDAVTAALEDGRFPREWLEETVRRILEFKQQHGILEL